MASKYWSRGCFSWGEGDKRCLQVREQLGATSNTRVPKWHMVWLKVHTAVAASDNNDYVNSSE